MSFALTELSGRRRRWSRSSTVNQCGTQGAGVRHGDTALRATTAIPAKKDGQRRARSRSPGRAAPKEAQNTACGVRVVKWASSRPPREWGKVVLLRTEHKAKALTWQSSKTSSSEHAIIWDSLLRNRKTVMVSISEYLLSPHHLSNILHDATPPPAKPVNNCGEMKTWSLGGEVTSNLLLLRFV